MKRAFYKCVLRKVRMVILLPDWIRACHQMIFHIADAVFEAEAMRKALLFGAFVGVATIAVAQTYNGITFTKPPKDTLYIMPDLLDAFTREGIKFKEVDGFISVLDGKDSTLLLRSEPEPLIINGELRGKSFVGKVPVRSKYIVKLEQVGYEPYITELTIPKKVYGKPVYSVRFEALLYKEAKQLQEITVQASKILMVNKGDTIEYNASAFRLSEGSMLDALIRNLPGVKLDEYGRITVNGEFVSSLLVNGRDFF